MKIKVQLNAKSIDKAIKKIEAYQKRIENLKPDFLKACAEKVAELANNNISEYEYDAPIIAEIKSGWRTKKGDTENSIILYNESEKATYIEFGVGQVGAGTHSEADEAGYEYDINAHGDKGWRFPIGEDDNLDLREPYYTQAFQTRKSGKYGGAYFVIKTKGEPATMFLFNAFMDFKDRELYKDIWNKLVKDL